MSPDPTAATTADPTAATTADPTAATTADPTAATTAVSWPNQLAQFTYTRSYARWDDSLGRRENYPETVDRVIDFFRRNVPAANEEDLEVARQAILNFEVMPSMRLMWSAGEAAERCNTMAYNCAFLPIDCLVAFSEALYILMSGTGVGYSVERQFVENLPKFEKRLVHTETIVIEDTTQAWALSVFDQLRLALFGVRVVFDYSEIRPAGARLRTKGGRSSGPGPLRALHEFVAALIETCSAERRGFTTLEASDVVCMIGEIVKAGGVRRAALICISDPDDIDMRHAKDWSRGNFPVCRYRANISAFWPSRPPRHEFDAEWEVLRASGSGERGFFTNPDRKLKERGSTFRTNPCGEINLRFLRALCGIWGTGGGGQFCNLTAAVLRAWDTAETLMEKARVGAMIGAWQASLTDFAFLRPGWKQLCDEDRLLGVDITGQADNPNLATDADLMTRCSQVAQETADRWADRIGMARPAAVTCGKPSGNSSTALDCASGFHTRYAPYYIRRVRVGGHDPLFALARDTGLTVAKDTGHEDKPDHEATWVVDFVVKSPEGALTRRDETALRQLDRYLLLMRSWMAVRGHNQSATIYVRDEEWAEVGDWLYEHFDEVGGLSFLPYDGGKYDLAPYEEITEEQYNALMADMPTIAFDLLHLYECEDMGEGAQTLACVAGACDI